MARPYSNPPPRKTGHSRLAQHWRDLRLGAQVDQHEVAAALGCSASHLSNIEQGRRIPSRDLLERYDALMHADKLLHSLWEWAKHERAENAVPESAARTLPGDRSRFVQDLAPDRRKVFGPEEHFTAAWEIQNVGKVTWKDRFIEQMSARLPTYAAISLDKRVAVPLTKPNESTIIWVPMRAALLPGTSRVYFQMVHADGTPCFPDRYADGVWVDSRVR